MLSVVEANYVKDDAHSSFAACSCAGVCCHKRTTTVVLCCAAAQAGVCCHKRTMHIRPKDDVIRPLASWRHQRTTAVVVWSSNHARERRMRLSFDVATHASARRKGRCSFVLCSCDRVRLRCAKDDLHCFVLCAAALLRRAARTSSAAAGALRIAKFAAVRKLASRRGAIRRRVAPPGEPLHGRRPFSAGSPRAPRNARTQL